MGLARAFLGIQGNIFAVAPGAGSRQARSPILTGQVSGAHRHWGSEDSVQVDAGRGKAWLGVAFCLLGRRQGSRRPPPRGPRRGSALGGGRAGRGRGWGFPLRINRAVRPPPSVPSASQQGLAEGQARPSQLTRFARGTARTTATPRQGPGVGKTAWAARGKGAHGAGRGVARWRGGRHPDAGTRPRRAPRGAVKATRGHTAIGRSRTRGTAAAAPWRAESDSCGLAWSRTRLADQGAHSGPTARLGHACYATRKAGGPGEAPPSAIAAVIIAPERADSYVRRACARHTDPPRRCAVRETLGGPRDLIRDSGLARAAGQGWVGWALCSVCPAGCG